VIDNGIEWFAYQPLGGKKSYTSRMPNGYVIYKREFDFALSYYELNITTGRVSDLMRVAEIHYIANCSQWMILH
jgi:hypothetical protein